MRLALLLSLFACGDPLDLQPTEATGAARLSFEDEAAGVRMDQFDLGGESATPLVDYLFVVDNSISMTTILPRVRAGFAALASDPNAFGERARVGVITTLPSDPEFPGALHPAVPATTGLELDPGFGGLVTGQRIREYREAIPAARKHFPARGCKGGWFDPAARAPGGQTCLEAHTQVGLEFTRVEAGLTALGQLLEREDFAFREGAAVNVIFVSDTHDPGADPGPRAPWIQDLVDGRPTAETLAERALGAGGASAFRLHAISPHSVCTGEDWTSIGPVYREAAAATGGADVDICRADDYRSVFEHIATVGAQPQQPLLVLERDPSEVLEVRVGGVPAPFVVEGRRVRLERLPVEASSIEVRYRFE